MDQLKTLGVMVGGLAMTAVVHGQVLYDGAQGTLPTGQGWGFLALPALASEAFSQGATRLDTMLSGTILAGWSRTAPSDLDRAAGFTLKLELQLESEAHISTNRAGLSVIVLGSDKKGVELGFWADRIWAQSDSPMFTQAEGVELAVVGGWRDVRVRFRGNGYRLTVDGTEVLTGAVRDYTPFVGPIDPYETPNFLFIGDNTTSARGAYKLRRVELVREPVAPPAIEVVGVSGERLELRWAVAGASASDPGPWRLERSDEIGTTAWSLVESGYVGEDGWVRAMVPVSGASGYYRLR